jgi:hypothetical protein
LQTRTSRRTKQRPNHRRHGRIICLLHPLKRPGG